MCFRLPIKVDRIDDVHIYLQSGQVIRLDKTIQIRAGMYVRLDGDIVVDVLPKNDGEAILKLIADTIKTV